MSGPAVVLFNLGGPDGSAAVRPFLRNLFGDPAIIPAPGPIRRGLAWLIAARRAPAARAIYARIGGASPLRRLTEEQAGALEERLRDLGGARVFVAMRYWRPFIAEAARAVAAHDPDRVALLPLYPQYSAATTGSSLAEWRRASREAGVRAPASAICCYPDRAEFAAAHAALIAEAARALPAGMPWRLLFSAHGLPKRTAARRGDPYQWQVERSAEAVVDSLGRKDLDWRVCYQSRVGPLEWIGPPLDDELARAAADGQAVVAAPVSFVSEHSETLVELDMEYRDMAARLGVPAYVRVPALGTHPRFLDALEGLARAALAAPEGTICGGGGAACPAGSRFRACPRRAADGGAA